jgi:hypothetical protein
VEVSRHVGKRVHLAVRLDAKPGWHRGAFIGECEVRHVRIIENPTSRCPCSIRALVVLYAHFRGLICQPIIEGAWVAARWTASGNDCALSNYSGNHSRSRSMPDGCRAGCWVLALDRSATD